MGALGTVLGGHAGLGHDKDIGHVLTGVVGGLVDNLLHVCCCCECGDKVLGSVFIVYCLLFVVCCGVERRKKGKQKRFYINVEVE